MTLACAEESIPATSSFPGGAIFEPKWDGYRIAVVRDDQKARLWSRQGKDLTDRFPDLAAAAVEQLDPGTVVDAEAAARRRSLSTMRVMTAVKQGSARPPAVDKKLLSADDYEQYQTFLKRWDRGATFRELPLLAVATAICGLLGIGFVAAVFWTEDLPPEQMQRIMYPVVALVSAGTGFYLWFAWWSFRRWRSKLNADAETFLRERIKDAPPSDRADDDPGNPYWWTGNYDPQRYYRSFRGMTREDREYIRNAYGDLDTYESNRPD